MRRALVIDPDPTEQHRVSQILFNLWPQIDLATAMGLKDGHARLGQYMPGLLVTDFYLPDGSGLELIEQTLALYPEAARVLITRHDDDAHIRAALRHGIDGYILKDQGDAGIKRLLAGIAKGEPGLSPEITRQILRQFQRAETQDGAGDGVWQSTVETAGLTRREVEVLKLLSQGWDRHRVGEALAIRPSTVAGHIKAIYLKLNVSTRAEATLAAVKMGLINLET
ncbi:response regulator [Spiribacter insolitus]|uniref:Response regulator transcription factor n=1 Tax=Spiribacter insolitus TaxID=3122417 RepID=A0ABV3T7X8_9GAMM